jgi:PPOX class probable F420-dependent enzyme
MSAGGSRGAAGRAARPQAESRVKHDIMALRDATREFLAEPRFAVLATVGPDTLPHQTTMWYELRGDDIIMNTKVGRLKERHLRRDPRISICVSDGYRYVTITGTAHLIDDEATAQEDIKRLATRYHGAEKAEQQVRDQFSRERRVSIQVPIAHAIEYGLDDA